MSVSALSEAPNFTLSKKFGNESGFWRNNAVVNKGQLAAKGNTLFKTGTDGVSPSEKFLTVTESYVGNSFDSNQSAYNLGAELAKGHKYMFLDFEGVWGNLDDYTTRQRVGFMLKGAQDNGALVGEFLYDVWNSTFVFDGNAKTQIKTPTINGSSNRVVEELGNMPMSQLYGLTKAIGYGSNYVNTRRNMDPRIAIYNYIYKMRVHQSQKRAGLVPANSNPMGYLWGGCDSFNSGKPPIRHRIYLESPYNGYIWINHHNEESLKIMKGFGIWAFIETIGLWYWNPQIYSSDKKNDIIDILYSGFMLDQRGYVGSSSLPGSRPEPARSYPFQDGLSNDVVWQAAHEFSQVESEMVGAAKGEPDYSFKRGASNTYIDIVVNQDGTGIVDAYESELPIVAKVVGTNKVWFVIQDPGAKEKEITKIKVSHAGRSFFISANSDEPLIYEFPIIASTPTPSAPTPSGSSYACTPVYSPLPGGYRGNQRFTVNGSGNSLDFSEQSGISPNKVPLFTAMAEEGVDRIRHTFKLGDYYAGGQYKDQVISNSLQWTQCLRGDLENEHLIVPVFTQNDNWLNDGDLWKDADGHDADCTFNFLKVPSYFSSNASLKKAEIYHHYFNFLKINHPDSVKLFSFGGGPSEEHYTTFSANYPGGPGCGNDKFGGIGDYSSSAQLAWKSYQTQKWQGLLPFLVDGVQYQAGLAPLPYIRPDSQTNRFIDLNRRDHREAVRFWNLGVFISWYQFVSIGRQYFPNAEFESFVADMYNRQGIALLMNAGAMHKLMTECNVWYHTENISPSEWAKCLVGTDIVKGGTYGSNKKSSVEFDSTDLGVAGGGLFDENLLEAKINKLLDFGCDYIHWALDFTREQIAQIGRVMRKVKAERINNPAYTPPSIAARANAETVTLNTANMWIDTDYIYTVWESTGNSRSNPFDAKLMNIRVHDGFYLDEQ